MKRNVSGSGGTAPSAKNRQPLKYIVYTGKKRQVAWAVMQEAEWLWRVGS